MNEPDRSDQPLAARFARLIEAHGPISLSHYMAESNARYYASRDPLGTGGDFITAPEISQMFGELIGLWLADMWLRAGSEEPVHYVELGPGRGVLARDALRAAQRHGLRPMVHFIETSPALKSIQSDHFPQARWHHDLSTVPLTGPVLVVGNEFLDALPIRQLVMTDNGWREVMVGYRDGRFGPAIGNKPVDAAIPEAARRSEPGTVIETCPAAAATVDEIARRLVDQGGAGLLIDYGHDKPRSGSTLQAVRAHRKVDAFAMPGEADLTAHVDFAALAPVVRLRGCKWLGTVSQGNWLRDMGIEMRAQHLARQSPRHADAIQSAKDRLTGETEMGALFKVMGLAAPHWPDGAGF